MCYVDVGLLSGGGASMQPLGGIAIAKNNGWMDGWMDGCAFHLGVVQLNLSCFYQV
jgi:hypothetical protein